MGCRNSTGRRRSLLGALIAVGALTAGCTSTEPGEAQPPSVAGSGVPSSWYDTLDERYAETEQSGGVRSVPVFENNSGCELDVTVEIAGGPADADMNAVHTTGDSGRSYVCRFTEPSGELSVTLFADAAEFATVDEARRAQEQAGNEQTDEEIVIGSRTFAVVRKSFPTNDSHIDYGVTYLDTDKQGLVRLDVETTDDRGLIDSYTPQQAAQDLATLLG